MFHYINWLGAFSLLKKETLRFLKVYHQTLFSPVVNIMLFFAIFCISIGNHLETIASVPFPIFIASGLIMMSAMQNAFANSSSSIVMSRVMGHVVDYIIPPLGAFELLFAFTIGGVLRGICVGIIAFIAISFFIKIPLHNFYLVIFYSVFSCSFLAMLGIICGMFSNTFDKMAAITSYFITPLTFLSGTFYSTESLPTFFRNISHFNPFFHIIDGFRYAITGHSDGNIAIGAFYIFIINIVLGILIFRKIEGMLKIQ
jgi:ABC-2 type transport system permease protein